MPQILDDTPAHAYLRKWLDTTSESIRLDLLDRLVADIQPKTKALQDEFRSLQRKLIRLAPLERKPFVHRRRVLQQTLQLLVPILRHAEKMRFQLRTDRPVIHACSFVEFLASRMLRVAPQGLRSPLGNNFRHAQVGMAITVHQSKLALQLMLTHDELFPLAETLVGLQLKSQFELSIEAAERTRMTHRQRRQVLVEKVMNSGINLDNSEIALLREMTRI